MWIEQCGFRSAVKPSLSLPNERDGFIRAGKIHRICLQSDILTPDLI
jgi:hypothetical protein